MNGCSIGGSRIVNDDQLNEELLQHDAILYGVMFTDITGKRIDPVEMGHPSYPVPTLSELLKGGDTEIDNEAPRGSACNSPDESK